MKLENKYWGKAKTFSRVQFLLIIMIISICGCTELETTAQNLESEKQTIMEVIENETTAFFQEDYELWISQHLQSPDYTFIGYWEGNPEKVDYTYGFDTLRENVKPMFDEGEIPWTGSEQVRDNIQIRISDGGDMAWVVYDQTIYDGESREVLGRSKEVRVVEKSEGDWKIAFLGYFYLPDLE